MSSKFQIGRVTVTPGLNSGPKKANKGDFWALQIYTFTQAMILKNDGPHLKSLKNVGPMFIKFAHMQSVFNFLSSPVLSIPCSFWLLWLFIDLFFSCKTLLWCLWSVNFTTSSSALIVFKIAWPSHLNYCNMQEKSLNSSTIFFVKLIRGFLALIKGRQSRSNRDSLVSIWVLLRILIAILKKVVNHNILSWVPPNSQNEC